MRRYPWRTKTPSTGRVVLRRGRDRSVGAGAALPERGDAEGADDEEGDRALVRPLRLRIDRGDGVLRLPFHDRLRPDPREVAHDGISAIDDAHAHHPTKKEAPLSAARAGPRESAGNLRAGEAPGGTRARPDVKTTSSRKTCAGTSTLRSVN